MPTRSDAVSRRGFLRKSSALCSTLLLTKTVGTSAAAERPPQLLPAQTRADVGSLFPVIQNQAVQYDFPLSFLHPRFKSMKRWKQSARAKVLDLLHYFPPRCDPAAEVVEKVDRGDHVREKVYFNTAP